MSGSDQTDLLQQLVVEEKQLRKSDKLTTHSGGSLAGSLLKTTASLTCLMGDLKGGDQEDLKVWQKFKEEDIGDEKARKMLIQQYQQKWNGKSVTCAIAVNCLLF